MVDSHAMCEQRKHANVQAVCQAPRKMRFQVEVGSSGYYAEISRNEALSLMQEVGQSLKLVHHAHEIEITGLKD